MTLPPPARRPLATTRGQLLYAVAFALAAALGRATIVDGRSLSLVWPAGGVAVLWWAWARAHRCRVSAALLLALATAGTNLATGAPPAVAAVFVLVNLVQAVVAERLLRAGARLGSGPGAGRLLLGAAAGAAAGVVVGAVGLSLLEVPSVLDPSRIVLWWGRNVTGIVVVAGLGLLVLERRASASRTPARVPPDRGRLLEAAALVATTTFCFAVLFANNGRAFVPLLGLTIWAGLRFSPLVVAAYTAACGLCSVVLTLAGLGPFAVEPDLLTRAGDVQLFVLSLSVLGLVLAGNVADQRRLVARAEAAEQVATARADLHTTILAVMEEGVVVLDAAGGIVTANAAAERLIAAIPGEVRRSGDATVLHPDGTEVAAEDLPSVRAMREGRSAARDLVVHRTGHHDPVVLSVSATRLADIAPYGTGPGAVVLYRDVTHERAHRDQLAGFAAMVAHDLRGPLSSVRGWVELAAAGSDAGPLLDRALDSAARMSLLIDDLLLHASSSQGELRLTDVDLAQVVEEVVALYDVAEVVTSGELPAVRVDVVLLRQLMANLVGNAVKYVGVGVRPRIAIEAAEAGGRVQVQVVDNGLGIAPAEREAVFRPFHRAHGELDVAGTGLGLALCRSIVERHGGQIAVEDGPGGEGSRFVFTLPSAVREQPASEHPQEAPAHMQVAPEPTNVSSATADT